MSQTSGDVDPRTGDLTELERNQKERVKLEKADAKNKKMGKLPPAASTDQSTIQARTEAVIKTDELHGKRELVAQILSRGNKGKSAGFYCETCDLTYKDSLSYLDHINSAERISCGKRS
jgi:U4/U6.U5 tri-snRNP component SNU23